MQGGYRQLVRMDSWGMQGPVGLLRTTSDLQPGAPSLSPALQFKSDDLFAMDAMPSALPPYLLNPEERRANSTDSTSTAHGAGALRSSAATSTMAPKTLLGPLRQVSLDLLTAAALAHDTNAEPERHSIFQDVLEQLAGRQDASVSRTASGLVPLPSLHFLEGLLDDMDMGGAYPAEPPLYLPLDNFDLVDRSSSGEQQPELQPESPRRNLRQQAHGAAHASYALPLNTSEGHSPSAAQRSPPPWHSHHPGPSRFRRAATCSDVRQAAPTEDDVPEMVVLTSKAGRVRRVASFAGVKRGPDALTPMASPAPLKPLELRPVSDSGRSAGADCGEEVEEVEAAGGRGGRRAKTRKSLRTTCLNCGCHSTPQWRCGPLGPRTLCNACGVRFKKGLPLNCWPLRDGMVLPPGAVLPPDLEVPTGMNIYCQVREDEAL